MTSRRGVAATLFRNSVALSARANARARQAGNTAPPKPAARAPAAADNRPQPDELRERHMQPPKTGCPVAPSLALWENAHRTEIATVATRIGIGKKPAGT